MNLLTNELKIMMDIGEDSSAKKLLIKLKKGDILIICSAINI